MFTGLVEEIGTVREIRRSGQSCRFTISCKKILSDAHLGDSIAVNGTCLTICGMDGTSFQADLTPETMRRTSFSIVRPGSPVNLERALSVGARLGGHIVLGHVDTTGKIISFTKEDNAVNISFSLERKWMRYVIEKGSIAVDGVSLTISERRSDGFSVALIPHTGEETILLKKHPGDPVNIECDYLGKYVENLIQSGPEQNISLGMLEGLKTGGYHGL